MKICITGTAGFIGYHLAIKCINEGHEVFGVDSINDYYDIKLKYGRLLELGISKEISDLELAESSKYPNFKFYKCDLADSVGLNSFFKENSFDAVCNLAAQAGVRYSLTHPKSYIKSNIDGFLNILEMCRYYDIENLSYASSSSVYGLNETYPFSSLNSTDHPISHYAATKKSNELMAHTYSHLFNIRTTGLRFFTVYGPWGRPDMALFMFTKAALEGQTIKVFNNGEMSRSFTYIDDIIDGVFKVIMNPATSSSSWDPSKPSLESSSAPYTIYNIGSNENVNLMDFIHALEEKLKVNISKEMLPMQPGDVPKTFADISSISKDLNYNPQTSYVEGISKFVNWYKVFYEKNR